MALAELHLALLQSGARHGYDLKQTHDAWFPDQRPLPFGQVYSTLARLVRDGLAEVTDVARDGGPERTVYSVTDAGRQRLRDWLVAPVRPTGASGEELLRKSIAALHSADVDVAEVLAAQRIEHSRHLQALRQAIVLPPVEAPPKTSGYISRDDLGRHLAHRSRLLLLEAELKWLEEAEESLEGSALEPPIDSPEHRPGRGVNQRLEPNSEKPMAVAAL